ERLTRWCRRNRALAVAGGVTAAALLGVAALALSFASYQARAAADLREKEHETRGALAEAQRQSILARRQTAFAALDQGVALCEQGHVRRGMLALAPSLEVSDALPESEAEDVEGAARGNLAAWRLDLPALAGLFPHPAVVSAVAFSPDGALAV